MSYISRSGGCCIGESIYLKSKQARNWGVKSCLTIGISCHKLFDENSLTSLYSIPLLLHSYYRLNGEFLYLHFDSVPSYVQQATDFFCLLSLLCV